MAKNEQKTETQNAEQTQPAANLAAPPAADERFKMVRHAETGEMVKRKDYILYLFQQKKWGRGQIAKHLSEITGKPVKYQIVFAATKGLKGGPDKPEAAPAATQASAAA